MARNARMFGKRRFLEQATRRSSKREANAAADRIRDRGMLARVTKESDGSYAVWEGPKR